MNNRWILFIPLIFSMTILACAIPGLQTASPPTLAPTTDTSGILSTMVADTVSAAITLTAQAFPTPTIIPTSTPISISTLTPTPEIISAGSTLAIQEDGSTLFTDEHAGYEITIPAGWLAVRVNQQEYQDALNISGDIHIPLRSIQDNDPNTFRLLALDTQDGHVQDYFFTNINFIWDEQAVVVPKNYDGLRAGVAQLPGAAPEPEILSTTLSATSSGISISVIELKLTMKNSSSADIVIFQKQVIFNSRTGTMAITLSTVEGLKDDVFAAFDAMFETIKVSTE